MDGPANLREFHYTRADFEQARSLLYRQAGINLSDSKEQMLYSRLARRLRALNLTDFSSYFSYMHQHEEEWQQFINALTTNLTAFFREKHHFETLANYARKHASQKRKLRVWSAAASTGEEPYSLGMTLIEAFGSFTPQAEILASDIDTGVLNTARQGIYAEARIEDISTERRKAFFLRGKGPQQGKVRVCDALRELVDFRQINLLDNDWGIEPGLDVIFCRNVMIYFDKATQTQLLERMVQLLQPDGLFFAGHSESFVQAAHLVRLVGHTVYRPSNRT
ncbi:CheR family methyltransferase [Pseudomonas sp.]|jgi:chemotaxis protein methyltransferase CheR|uniref:CheR family methyltransferase n=1 Tax=Pseudomonas sp. TaxID=306 RepID=UPI00398250F6